MFRTLSISYMILVGDRKEQLYEVFKICVIRNTIPFYRSIFRHFHCGRIILWVFRLIRIKFSNYSNYHTWSILFFLQKTYKSKNVSVYRIISLGNLFNIFAHNHWNNKYWGWELICTNI